MAEIPKSTKEYQSFMKNILLVIPSLRSRKRDFSSVGRIIPGIIEDWPPLTVFRLAWLKLD